MFAQELRDVGQRAQVDGLAVDEYLVIDLLSLAEDFLNVGAWGSLSQCSAHLSWSDCHGVTTGVESALLNRGRRLVLLRHRTDGFKPARPLVSALGDKA